jgi:transcription factor C subunit 6
VHQSAIRALNWVRVPDRHGNGPTVIASGGYDGLQCLTDIREPGGHVFNRTRGALLNRLALTFFLRRFPTADAINSIVYSPYMGSVVTIDHENTIKSYSLSPSTLGRGHALMDPGGPVWVNLLFSLVGVHQADDAPRDGQSVNASDYHPQLAVGSSDGTCCTTNGLRATRRGGYVVSLFFVPRSLAWREGHAASNIGIRR